MDYLKGKLGLNDNKVAPAPEDPTASSQPNQVNQPSASATVTVHTQDQQVTVQVETADAKGPRKDESLSFFDKAKQLAGQAADATSEAVDAASKEASAIKDDMIARSPTKLKDFMQDTKEAVDAASKEATALKDEIIAKSPAELRELLKDDPNEANMTDEEKRAALLNKVVKGGAMAISAAQATKAAVTSTAKTAAMTLAKEADELYENNVSAENKAKVTAAQKKAKDYAKTVAKKGAELGGKAVEGYLEGKKLAAQAAQDAYDALPPETKKIFEERQRFLDELKQKAIAKVMDVSDPLISKVMKIAGNQVKELLTDDADMPEIVVEAHEYAVDTVWPDIEVEVRNVLNRALRKEKPIDEGPPPTCGCCGQLRAWILYRLFPYNKSVWGRISYPSWWLFTLLLAFPLYGARVFFFMILLLLIDKDDEYQLLFYIMSFKSFQFVSGGLLAGFIGGMQYYACLNFLDPDNLDDTYTCDDDGPGNGESTLVILIVFVLTQLLTWLAFMYVPTSRKKGEIQFIASTEEERLHAAEEEARAGAGCCACCGLLCFNDDDDDDDDDPNEHKNNSNNAGDDNDNNNGKNKKKNKKKGSKFQQKRLMWLLIYDSIMFILCTCLLLIVWSLKWDNDDIDRLDNVIDFLNHWQIRADIFWCLCFYSLTTFPFLIVNFPVINSLVLHTRPTGYTKNGNCVAMVSPPPRRLKEKPDDNHNNDIEMGNRQETKQNNWISQEDKQQ